MEAEQKRFKYEQIVSLVEIIKGYIETIKNHELQIEYRHEIEYFKAIIKGLLIDDTLGDKLEKAGRSIYLSLYKEHIEASKDMGYIDKLFKKLYDNQHELRNNLFYYDSTYEVRLINNLLELKWNKRGTVERAARQVDKKFREIDKILEIQRDY